MDDIARQAHANFVAFNRWRAVNEDSAVLDAGGVFAAAGATDFPSSRSAVLHDLGGPVEAAIAGHEFLIAHGNTALIYAQVGGDDAVTAELTELGYVEYSQTPEMVCVAPLPAGDVTVRLSESLDDAREYAQVAATAFTELAIPEEETLHHLAKLDVLLKPDVVVALAEVDGRVMAGALVLLVGGHGYVGWVSTLSEGRGRGLGDAVTRRVTNEAFERGAATVTLEASPFGEAIYRRMGYRELYRYRMLIKL